MWWTHEHVVHFPKLPPPSRPTLFLCFGSNFINHIEIANGMCLFSGGNTRDMVWYGTWYDLLECLVGVPDSGYSAADSGGGCARTRAQNFGHDFFPIQRTFVLQPMNSLNKKIPSVEKNWTPSLVTLCFCIFRSTVIR